MSEIIEEDRKFSIFDPVITRRHREFYEQIVNELNVILPVCNHGKSLAVDIGRNAKEQDTIKDLMSRVETFRGELLDGTKKLFGQFYLAKEEFFKMILSTVAYGKINTLDRNLLERTCDVRWWAHETTFHECLKACNTARELMDILLESAAKEIETLKRDESVKRLFAKPHERKELENLAKFRSLFKSGKNSALLSADTLKEASESAPAITEFLTKAGMDSLADVISRCVKECKESQEKAACACERLETINSSYTLYRDLIICDSRGMIIANANRKERSRVIGLDVSSEKWFDRAVKLSGSDEYYAQNIMPSLAEEQDSLVYSAAVREEDGQTGGTIGALGVFFDFQGEAQIILNDHMPKDRTGLPEDGWLAFFTSKDGRIIASVDEHIAAPGERCPLPRSHRSLKPGETCAGYTVIGGARVRAVFTARTDGYLDYKGQDWNSHVAAPKDAIFNGLSRGTDVEIDSEELMSSQITPEINKLTYKNIERDKRALQLISTNGILFAAELGARGQSLGPVFEQITKTGDFATRCMEELLREMAIGGAGAEFHDAEDVQPSGDRADGPQSLRAGGGYPLVVHGHILPRGPRKALRGKFQKSLRAPESDKQQLHHVQKPCSGQRERRDNRLLQRGPAPKTPRAECLRA